MLGKIKILELINDWINMNPTFKKKFTVDDFYLIPNKSAHVSTEQTSKTNQTTLQRLLPAFLKYISIDVDKVFVTNLLQNFNLDFQEVIKNYLLKTGLKENQFFMNVSKISQNFTDIQVLVDVDIFELLNLQNLHLDHESLFSFNTIDKKYKGQFSYNLKFTSKLNESIANLNREMRRYLQRRNWEIFQEMNPTIGIFRGDTKIEVFINNNGREHMLERTLDNFFKHFRLNKNYHWRTYRRGPWLDEKYVDYGFKN